MKPINSHKACLSLVKLLCYGSDYFRPHLEYCHCITLPEVGLLAIISKSTTTRRPTPGNLYCIDLS